MIQFYMPDMTFSEIEEKIVSQPKALIPLGSMEPIGTQTAIGACETVTLRIALRLSEMGSMLCCPCVSYSGSLAFSAFGGCFGLKHSTYEAVVKTVVSTMVRWKITHFFFIEGNYYSFKLSQSILKHLKKHGIKHVSLLNWQTDPEIRSFIQDHQSCVENARLEYALFSLIHYLCPESIRPLYKPTPLQCVVQPLHSLKSKGYDPDIIRKLYPDSRLGNSHLQPDDAFASELFQFITTCFLKKINNLHARE